MGRGAGGVQWGGTGPREARPACAGEGRADRTSFEQPSQIGPGRAGGGPGKERSGAPPPHLRSSSGCRRQRARAWARAPFPASPPRRAPWRVCLHSHLGPGPGPGPDPTAQSPLSPPGLGHSKEAVAPTAIGELAPSSFLQAVLEALELGSTAVVSPSLSGMYSLPFLTAPSTQLCGYVPVAPICTDKVSPADYGQVKTPTLIVYGDQDPMGESSLKHLQQLPNHQVMVMVGTGHPCYLDSPDEWHSGLLNFLNGLSS
ncbi:putative protein-lysine deacylase ABHD14B isoform X1 [Phascolarctos cinereus]